jgi:hypothetical protein
MQRRIGHLMKTLGGKMGGDIELRRDVHSPWVSCYCYIKHTAGRLMIEPGTDGPHQTLISNLPGASTQYSIEKEELLIEVRSADLTEEVHIRPATQQEFDAWYAALAHWKTLDAIPNPAPARQDVRPPSEMSTTSNTPTKDTSHHQRRASATNNRSRAGSNRSDRRRSLAATVPKENPVIKVGQMIYWELPVGLANASTTSLGQGSSSRSGNYMMQAASTRRWRRISGQLRENGELKLYAEDNSLISLLQLSQLSRCAIQRLDLSVLETDHCIAIYPQYLFSHVNGPSNLNRPILLSLESRVLYEVWFVLLRAFTMPSIYAPRIEGQQGLDSSGLDLSRDVENMISTSTSYAFRMERKLNIRILEAKLVSPTVGVDSLIASGLGKSQAYNNADKHGLCAEILLDGETRGRTDVKYDSVHPLWLQNFEFQDLPPVLGSASVTLRRRPPESVLSRERDVCQMPETFTEQQGVVASLGFDVLCGKVDIQLDELEGDHTVDRWWPAFNAQGQKIGDVLINARAEEGVVLMARDYLPLANVLQDFDNSLTVHMADLIPTEIKRLCDCLLDIFQASGKATQWIMALIEEEIDGLNKDTPITRSRYIKPRTGSDAATEAPVGSYTGASEREAIVRDLNKTAALEANLLFRGNTLLTRALDTHMRRIGKEWLEASLTETLYNIVIKDLDCEVDPSRTSTSEANWGRLLLATQDVWRAIMAASSRCPVELRLIFRHIRICAEDRYGDHLRTVQYSSVSGFLFLRFFVPAVLNPNLFGLMKGGRRILIADAGIWRLKKIYAGDLKPRTRRTLTLIAKSLQTMANMATFGAKEPWMEPMNAFIVQHREGFKRFVDEVCHLPESAISHPSSPTSPPTYPADLISVEHSMSYRAPTAIMQRLPQSSREGYPSLPYLVDQPRAFAELIRLWLESVRNLSRPTELAAIPTRSHEDILNAIAATDPSFVVFNELCESLSARTDECLARAERAEPPGSVSGYVSEESIIDQLRQAARADDRDRFELLANKIADDPSILPQGAIAAVAAAIAQLRSQMDENAANGMNTSSTDDEQYQTRPSTQTRPSLSSRHYSPTPPRSAAPSIMESTSRYNDRSAHSTRPSSSAATATPSSNPFYSSSIFNRSTITAASLLNGSSSHAPPIPPAPALQRPYPLVKSSTSPGHSAAASVSNLSSAVSSDTEPGTTAASSHHSSSAAAPTALPSYEREVRLRERREAARLEIQQSVEAARVRELAKSQQKNGGGALSGSGNGSGGGGGGGGGGKISVTKLVPGFAKKKKDKEKEKEKEREKEAAAAAAAAAGKENEVR